MRARHDAFGIVPPERKISSEIRPIRASPPWRGQWVAKVMGSAAGPPIIHLLVGVQGRGRSSNPMGSAIMSGSLSTAILPVSGVGVQAVVAQLPIAVVAGAARATLPYTGIALGAYVGLALTFLVVGLVLRFFGNAGQEA
jgi:hypothetical protein